MTAPDDTTAEDQVGDPVGRLEGQSRAASRLLDEDRDASGGLTTVDSRWDPRRGVLVTELKGQVDVEAVETLAQRAAGRTPPHP